MYLQFVILMLRTIDVKIILHIKVIIYDIELNLILFKGIYTLIGI